MTGKFGSNNLSSHDFWKEKQPEIFYANISNENLGNTAQLKLRKDYVCVKLLDDLS